MAVRFRPAGCCRPGPPPRLKSPSENTRQGGPEAALSAGNGLALARRRNAGPGPVGRSLRAGLRPAIRLRCGGLTGDGPAGATAPCGPTGKKPAEWGFVIVWLGISCHSLFSRLLFPQRPACYPGIFIFSIAPVFPAVIPAAPPRHPRGPSPSSPRPLPVIPAQAGIPKRSKRMMPVAG